MSARSTYSNRRRLNANSNRNQSRRRRLIVENLESRQMLAADFEVNAIGLDVQLQRIGDSIQVIDRSDSSVIRSEGVDDIDSKMIEITSRSLLVDSSVDIEANSLAVSAGSISVIGGAINSDADVTLTAIKQPDLLGTILSDAVLRGLLATETYSIEIHSASIFANQIVLSAEGATSTGWDELGAHQDGIAGDLISQLEAIPQIGLSSVGPLSGQAKIHSASANITLEEAVLQSQTSIDVIATAAADASLNAIAVTGLNASGLPVSLSVGFSRSQSSATIDMLGTSQITATAGNVRIATDATSTAETVSRSEANSRATAPDAPKVSNAINLALAFTDETSTINVGERTAIDAGGAVWVDATSSVANEVSATTAIFNDGTVGFSGAVGVDNATVTSQVHGKIMSRETGTRRIEFPGKDLFSSQDAIIFREIPASNPLKVGEAITYQNLGGGDLGLDDSQTYIIHEITNENPVGDKLEQTVRLIRAASIELDNRQVAANSQHSLTRLGMATFAAADVATEAGTSDGLISVSLPSGVTRVTYLGPQGNDDPSVRGIDGLVQSQVYEVTVVGGQIKLRLPGETAFIDFDAPANGNHGFRFAESVQTFAPETAVDSEGNWIELPSGHGLQTGDFLLYQTDPAKSVTQEMFAFDADGEVVGSLGNVTLPDAPIKGLRTNHGYYAVADSRNPNRIRLAGSLAGALAAAVVDVRSAVRTGNPLDHAFDREQIGGIRVTASLAASNKAESGVNLTEGEQPWSAVVGGALAGRIENIASAGIGFFDSLRDSIQGNGVSEAIDVTDVDPNQTKAPDDSSESGGFDAAGSIAVAFFDHDVHAIIGATAVLASDTTITVDADIVQRTKLGSIAESTRGSLNEEGDKGNEFAVSGGIGIYNNDAQAVIVDQSLDSEDVLRQATLNARGETRVDSEIVYPFLASDDDGVNGAVTIDQLGLDGFQSFLDGTHGLAGLVNVYSRTLASGDDSKLSLALGIMVTDTTNQALASIGQGVQVNQDPSFASDDQFVVVESLLDVFVIEAGHMSSLNLSAPGLAEAISRGNKRENGSVHDFLSDLANPLGVSGKNGAGGSMLLTLTDNSAVAEIRDHAVVNAKEAVTVNAVSDIYNLAMVQTGTGSTQFGFSAAIAASDIRTDTRASIGASAKIDAGALVVLADDVLDRVTIVGAFLKGKQVGIGTSVGVNVIAQNVDAHIGHADSLNVGGLVDVSAIAGGDMFSLVMAGALQGVGSNASSAKADAKPIGPIALTVPVAVNHITGNVTAYLESQQVDVGSIVVHAQSGVEVQAVVVGASFAVQVSSTGPAGKLNLAGAGAVGVNTIEQNVAAFIKDSDVLSAGDVSVTALDRSNIEADAGGFSIAASLSPATRTALSAGVSVAINDISGVVASSIENSDVALTGGDLLVDANSDSLSKALGIAGSVSANLGAGQSGSFGGAGAAAQNVIAKRVSAELNTGSTVTGNAVTVTATDSSEIVADAGGVGIGVTGGAGGSIAGAVGISMAINEVGNTVRAAIDTSTVTASDQVSVIAASDEAKISALTIAASAGLAGSAGFAVALVGAGAGSGNTIANTVTATINNSAVTSTFAAADDRIKGIGVNARDDSEIVATSIGAALGATLSSTTAVSVAVGVSVANNEISNKTTASVIGSTLDSLASIHVVAEETASISAISTAASVSLAIGSTGIGISGAGAAADNVISNQTVALVNDSVIKSTDDVLVTAIDMADITALVRAASVAIAGGVTGAAASFGVSSSSNRIGDSATFLDDPTAERGAGSAQVKAYVNQSQIDADGRLNVTADAKGTIMASVVAGSVAAAAGSTSGAIAGTGVSVANDVEVEIVAVIQDTTGPGIDADHGVAVVTTSDFTIESFVGAASLAIAAGVYAGGLSVAAASGVTDVKNKLQSQIRRSVVNAAAGGISILASDDNDVTVTATASSVAEAISLNSIAVAGGGAGARGTITSIVDSRVEDSTLTATSSITIESSQGSISDVQTEVTSVAAGAIGIGLSGSSATSIITPVTNAQVIASEVTALGLAILVFSNPVATANAAGMTVSTGLAVGVSAARVELGGTVLVSIGSRGNGIVVGNLGVNVDSGNYLPSRAFAQGSAGGVLLGVDATVTSAVDTTQVTAEIADESVIDSVGDISITNSHTAELIAQSSSLAAGLVAAGVSKSSSESSAKITTRIGANVDLDGDNLTLSATSRPKNFAKTVAGAVGGVSGAVAIPNTRVVTEAIVEIGDNAAIHLTGDASLFAVSEPGFDSTLLAAAGGFISGGGGDLDNVIMPTTRVDIGNGVTFDSTGLDLRAESQLTKRFDHFFGNVDATAGGLIAGVGVDSHTDLTIRTTIDIGADAAINIDNLSGGDVSMVAKNRIDALDELTLRSGGVAAGGSNISTIRTLADDAIVTFAPRSSLITTGTASIYTGGSGDIDIQANSETFGGATIGSGVSTIDIRPNNRISLQDGASIETGRDLNLAAGTDTHFNPDEYNIHSRVDTFAGSLIPIDVMDARAFLYQENQITISAGATVRSAGDVRMHAEQFGDNNVLAQVKAVNWTTGVTGVIDGLLGEGGVEQFAGTADSDASGIVTVAGTVQTGIARNRVLEITSIDRVNPPNNPNGTPGEETPDLYTVNLSDRSTGDVPFQKIVEPINSALDLALAQAEEQLATYSDNAQLKTFYEREVTRLKAELAEQNLLDTPPGAPAGYLERVERLGLTLLIDPIFAKAGSIDVRADSLVGSGVLEAPGDASVEIINDTRAQIDLLGIEVPEDNGGVFLNGRTVGGGEGVDAATFILVDNTYIVPSGSSSISWPNITVSGPIENLGGDVTLRTVTSGAGSITINASVSGETQTISAGNNGSVVINLPDVGSVYEAGGAEHAKWNKLTERHSILGTVGGQGTTSAEPTVLPGGTFNLGITSETNPAVTSYLATEPTDISLIGSAIFVSAQYINVNGIIQSGKPEYKLVIGSATANEIASLQQNSSLTGLIKLNSVDRSDLLARWDADRDRIVVEELRVSGGYVDLTGHIANTRNGQIRVLSDYAKINIDNQTSYDIEVKRLDVSRRGRGTVIIKDLSDATAEDPRVSIYQREGDVIRTDTPAGVETVANGTNFIYQPKENLRYGWTIAEEELERTTVKYGSSSWLGLDFIAPDPEDEISRTVQPIGVPKILDAGPYFFVGPSGGFLGLSLDRYTYSSQEYTFPSTTRTCCNYQETNWIGTTTYYSTRITTRGTRTLHTHTIEADRPIDIQFQGQSEGEILIESVGNVFIAGALVNPNGTTTIHSDGSVLQGSVDGVVGGNIIRVFTERSIGNEDVPLRTNVVDVVPFDLRSDAATARLVNVGSRVRIAEDHVAGGEPGDVYRYQGTRAMIDLSLQDYTDEASWTRVELFSSVGLQTTDGHISVYEISGDLPIERVWANRAQTDETDGDVFLSAQGSIVQGRAEATTYHLGWVDGNAIHLESETGSIGQLDGDVGGEDRALPVDAGYFNEIKNPNHRLTATAAHDIYMHHFTSMILDRVVAGGDVRIDFVAGGTLIDGNPNDVSDERAIAEIAAKVWDDLQLTVHRGSGDKRDERIAALVASQTQSYAAYWNFRETQVDPSAYDLNHRVTLSDEEADFYDGDEAAITTLEESRTVQYHDLHDTWGSRGDSRIEGFVYEPSTEELDAIDASMKVWTDDELLSLRSIEFLNVTDTEFVIEEPNIVGRNVTLNVTEGIGRYDNGTTIDLRSTDGNAAVLTLDEQANLTAAEPGDIVYLQQAPSLVLARINGDSIDLIQQNEDTTVWADYGFVDGQFVYLESNTRDTTDDGMFYEITAIEGTRMTLDVSETEAGSLQLDQPRNILIAPAVTDPADHDSAPFIRVLRREDIDLEITGLVTATSNRHIFIGSESSLHIDRVEAGADQRVQIKIEGDLSGEATSNGEANIVGGRIVLESGAGSLGAVASPIGIESGQGGYLIARADNEVVVEQRNETGDAADLQINQVFSKTSIVQIEADGSIFDAFHLDTTNIQAVEIVLRAGGSIGKSDDFLDINAGENGSVTAIADGSIWIVETAGNLNVRQILSRSGDVSLMADVSILDAVDVADPYDPESADGNIIAGNPRADLIGNHVALTANLGGIGVAGNELDIDSSHAGDSAGFVTVHSTGNAYVNETNGDLVLANVFTDDTAFIAALSGSIYGRPDAPPDVIHVDGKVWLFAADNIGTAALPLRVGATFVEGQATTGDVFLETIGEIFVGGVIENETDNSGEGEFVNSRHGATQGISAGRTLSILSPQTVNVSEGLSSLGDILITARSASLPAGRWVQSGGDIVFTLTDSFDAGTDSEISADGELIVQLASDSATSGLISIDGSVLAMQSILRGTGLADTVIFTPNLLSGLLVIETGDGDDTVETNQGNVQFSGGDGTDLLKLIGSDVHLDLLALPDGALESLETLDLRGDGGNTLLLSLAKLANQDSQAGYLELIYDEDDSVDYGAGWVAEAPMLVGNSFVHVARQSGVEIRIQNPTPYVNPLDRFDVNRSGEASALDALVIINRLARIGDPNSNGLTMPITEDDLAGFLYLDANNDNRVSALDALNIINSLSRISSSGESEKVLALAIEPVGSLTQTPSEAKDRIDRTDTSSPMADKVVAKLIANQSPVATPLAAEVATTKDRVGDDVDSTIDEMITLLALDVLAVNRR
ncbi:MAG: dockerin type I domain-containing protein [Rubripirellula sp.]